MTTPRADKGATPPKTYGTTYEISIAVQDKDLGDATVTLWRRVATITTKSGAPAARRIWASAADNYAGELLRAVPISNINEGAFDVAIERKLTPKPATPGAP